MQTWENVSDKQPVASRILMNSLEKNRISHAYLLHGGRGTGKKSLATLFAKTLFCQNKTGINPCEACNICKRITSHNYPDVHWIEPEGQSIKIEQIRLLQSEFTYSGLESEQKVYILTAADTLTVNAANRLLKFLEEPNKQTTAILLTENIGRIIPTIRSRCQLIDLQPLNEGAFRKKLESIGINPSETALLSTLTNDIDEAKAFSQDEWFAQARTIVLQLINMYATTPTDVFLYIHQDWLPHFKERKQQELGYDLLMIAFKDLLYAHMRMDDSLVMYTYGEESLMRALHRFTAGEVSTVLRTILEAKRKLQQNVHPTLVLEQLALHI